LRVCPSCFLCQFPPSFLRSVFLNSVSRDSQPLRPLVPCLCSSPPLVPRLVSSHQHFCSQPPPSTVSATASMNRASVFRLSVSTPLIPVSRSGVVMFPNTVSSQALRHPPLFPIPFHCVYDGPPGLLRCNLTCTPIDRSCPAPSFSPLLLAHCYDPLIAPLSYFFFFAFRFVRFNFPFLHFSGHILPRNESPISL